MGVVKISNNSVLTKTKLIYREEFSSMMKEDRPIWGTQTNIKRWENKGQCTNVTVRMGIERRGSLTTISGMSLRTPFSFKYKIKIECLRIQGGMKE